MKVMCSTSGQFPYKKEMSLMALFPFPTGWNTDVMTGGRAAILDYNMETTCWWWQNNKTRILGPRWLWSHQTSHQPTIQTFKWEKKLSNKCHFGGMSFCHSSQADILNNRVNEHWKRISGKESNHFKLGRSKKTSYYSIFPVIQFVYWYLAAINVVDC